MIIKSTAPPNYICPICVGNSGLESEQTLLKQEDLVYQDDLVLAWINSFWIMGNEGHVIIVPREHFENLYDLPKEVGYRVFEVSQHISAAMKDSYGCAGITLRQNNEPAGDQHAFHYHLHVFPRYNNDEFNFQFTQKSTLSDPLSRISYCKKLQKNLHSHA